MTTPDSTLGQKIVNTLLRLATHVALLAAVVALLALAYPQLWGRAPSPSSVANETPRPDTGRGASSSSVASAGSDLALDSGDQDIPFSSIPQDILPLAAEGSLFKSPQMQTIIPKRPRKELVIYPVQQGDNLSTIAERYDVDVDTLIWANDKLEEDPDYLVIGQKLTIPPVSGVLYSVKTGDTLDAIATKFKGDLRMMQELEYNNLSASATVPVSGTQIMIPGGEKAYQPRLVYIGGKAVMVNAPKGGGRFMWPTAGWISTDFGENGHAGIDIAGPLGTPIYAADAGVVIFAGWNGGYGNSVIIDHGNGYQTIYGHFMAYYPQAGQNVRRGQAIGKMGSTGNSSGSHLHFEMHYQGGLVNPMKYLPQ